MVRQGRNHAGLSSEVGPCGTMWGKSRAWSLTVQGLGAATPWPCVTLEEGLDSAEIITLCTKQG